MSMTQRQLALALDATPQSVTIWKSQGMPVEDVDAARAWVAANVRRRKSARVTGIISADNPQMGPKARLHRAAEGEIRHYELWKAASAGDNVNSRTVAELAGAWRDSRKAAASAEQEYGAFLAMTQSTLNKLEAVTAIRSLISAVVQDFSTQAWGQQATSILQKHLKTLPESLSEATRQE